MVSSSGPFWCKVTPLLQLFAPTGEMQEPVGNTTLPMYSPVLTVHLSVPGLGRPVMMWQLD